MDKDYQKIVAITFLPLTIIILVILITNTVK